jgi:hypothetical protein
MHKEMYNNEQNCCQEHSGHGARIECIEKAIEDTWKAIEKTNNKIDTLKNWVIAGMSSLIAQLLITVITIIIAWLKVRGIS